MCNALHTRSAHKVPGALCTGEGRAARNQAHGEITYYIAPGPEKAILGIVGILDGTALNEGLWYGYVIQSVKENLGYKLK